MVGNLLPIQELRFAPLQAEQGHPVFFMLHGGQLAACRVTAHLPAPSLRKVKRKALDIFGSLPYRSRDRRRTTDAKLRLASRQQHPQ
jgi:hypothetical protein